MLRLLLAVMLLIVAIAFSEKAIEPYVQTFINHQIVVQQ